MMPKHGIMVGVARMNTHLHEITRVVNSILKGLTDGTFFCLNYKLPGFTFEFASWPKINATVREPNTGGDPAHINNLTFLGVAISKWNDQSIASAPSETHDRNLASDRFNIVGIGGSRESEPGSDFIESAFVGSRNGNEPLGAANFRELDLAPGFLEIGENGGADSDVSAHVGRMESRKDLDSEAVGPSYSAAELGDFGLLDQGPTSSVAHRDDQVGAPVLDLAPETFDMMKCGRLDVTSAGLIAGTPRGHFGLFFSPEEKAQIVAGRLDVKNVCDCDAKVELESLPMGDENELVGPKKLGAMRTARNDEVHGLFTLWVAADHGDVGGETRVTKLETEFPA